MDAELRRLGRGGTSAKLIKARMRAGLVTVEQVRLAAYCGMEEASVVEPVTLNELREILCFHGFVPEEPLVRSLLGRWPFTPWVAGLRYYLDRAGEAKLRLARCALAVAELCYEPWRDGWRGQEGAGQVDPDQVKRVIQAVRNWIQHPCEGHRIECAALSEGVADPEGHEDYWDPPSAIFFGACMVVVIRRGDTSDLLWRNAVKAARVGLTGPERYEAEAEEALKATINAAVLDQGGLRHLVTGLEHGR